MNKRFKTNNTNIALKSKETEKVFCYRNSSFPLAMHKQTNSIMSSIVHLKITRNTNHISAALTFSN